MRLHFCMVMHMQSFELNVNFNIQTQSVIFGCKLRYYQSNNVWPGYNPVLSDEHVEVVSQGLIPLCVGRYQWAAVALT